MTGAITSKTRIPELDGVRGIAIASVLFWHYFACFPHTKDGAAYQLFDKLGSLTWAGVDLFFVLSGFLVGGILIDNRESPNVFRAFYVRRSVRIFPLYFAWVALYALLLPLVGGRFPWLFGEPLPTWTYVAYVQNVYMALADRWGPHWLAITWSLAIEEQFYLILPLLVVLLKPRWLLGVCVAAAVTAPLVRLVLLAKGHDLASYVLLPARWDSLFIGVLGARMLREPRVVDALTRRPWALHGAVLLSLAWLALWTRNPGRFSPPPAMEKSVLALFSLAFILFAVVSPWRGFLRMRWLMALGTVAYGVYIFHEGVAGLVHGLSHGGAPRASSLNDLGLMGIAVAITVGLSVVSFRYFETPFTRFGRRYTYAGAPETGLVPPAAAGPREPEAAPAPPLAQPMPGAP